MVAVPAPTAVIFPAEETVATLVLLLVHLTEEGVIVFGDTVKLRDVDLPSVRVVLVVLREI